MIECRIIESKPLKIRDGHVVYYDNRTRNPAWVCEHLSRQSMTTIESEPPDRKKCPFTEDQSIHPFFRSTNVDYFKSGYDRGHLAAAANHRRTLSAMKSTFFFSNISPQVGDGFNRDAWNNLEKYTRRLAKQDDVYVCSGPLYMPHKQENGKMIVSYEVIGPNRVAVPTHFFKVLVIQPENRPARVQAFLMPNKAIPPQQPLSRYLVPLERIERAAGFTIFDQLPNKYGLVQKANGQLAGDFLLTDTT
eukprot:TRINITY_DN9700_c0_g1_i2.p1 TRINITY_DN9700_c0_g1~~TRINITY_DN9700_c0_g1_i2.p1  ORF type:complete len:248 (+),score=32.73 TRINITY_DN9700_c0_g1_i2:215-958(+)